MHLTSMSRYGVKIMMDIAWQLASGDPKPTPLQRRAIAARQRIPVDYMDHILARLREAGLIRSIRGRSGGFVMGRAPETISVWDIVSAVEEDLRPVRCLGEAQACQLTANCMSHDAWIEVFTAVHQTLDSIDLRGLVARWQNSHPHAARNDLYYSESSPGSALHGGVAVETSYSCT